MGTVGIFWDYGEHRYRSITGRNIALSLFSENCPPPSSETGFTTVRKIRQAIHSLGPISVFKAYVDVHLQSSKASSIKQSQLQSSGVSIIHCPHNARKEVADKTLIGQIGQCYRGPNLFLFTVDMLFFALECSGLSTIVLITGDKDFSYALSMLRSRGHMIVTICPSHSTHGDMQELADKFLYWRSEVLGIEGNGRRLSTANETCCRSSALLQIHQDFSMKGTVYPTIRPSALHEANTAGSQTVSDQNDIYIDDWDIMCSSGSSHSPDEDSLSEWGELVLDYTELDPCVQYAGPGTINPSTLSIAEVQDEGNVDVHCLKNSTRTMTLSLQQGSATISPDIKHPGFKMRAGDNLLPVDLIADSSPLLIGNACMTGAKIDPDAASFTGKMQLSPEVCTLPLKVKISNGWSIRLHRAKAQFRVTAQKTMMVSICRVWHP